MSEHEGYLIYEGCYRDGSIGELLGTAECYATAVRLADEVGNSVVTTTSGTVVYDTEDESYGTR